ncbi:4Fe-4S binding protein, partial [Chloroflexota bacterium]
ILTIDKDECSACELCVEACPAGCISIDTDSKAVICCDLCGGQPQCVLSCHAHCLTEMDSSQASDKQNVEYLARVLEQEDLRNSVPERRS